MQIFDRTTLEILEPLSRLIPEEPILAEIYHRTSRLYRCPCCHHFSSKFQSFCSYCGQALNWDFDAEGELFLVLSVPLDQIDAVRRYSDEGGEAPSCVDPRAIAQALDYALTGEDLTVDEVEVPGNE